MRRKGRVVIKLGQVPVGIDDAGVVLAEEGFGGGADAKALGQAFAAALRHPGDLGGEALHVVLLLL